MSAAVVPTVEEELRGRDSKTALIALLFVGGSVVVHALGFFALDLWVKHQPVQVPQKPLDLVMIDVPPPPPPPKPEEKKEEPKPPPPKPKIKVAKVDPPKEIPKEQPPPPPNETPPPTPTKPVPLVVGISMSSTTANGAFAAPVGNTQYGKVADKAVNPQDVKAYSAPKYMPSYQVDSQPEVKHEEKPPYPEEARKAAIEGKVQVKITIDTTGKVVDATIVKGLGYGLDEATLQAIRKFVFSPAVKNGEPVSTTIVYGFNWELD